MKLTQTQDKRSELAVVCFSGGHSSALVAIEAVRKYGKNNVVLLNHDISSHVEHQDIKRFKEDVENYCDVSITYANADDYENNTPLAVCKKKQAFNIGNQQAFCTHALKTQPFQTWLLNNFPTSGCALCKDIEILYGFDASETERITRRSQRLGVMGYQTGFPLAFWGRTIEKTEDVGIRRPITYHLYKHANCEGCLKAGRQHWYCVYCMRPDIWEEAKQAEDEIGYSIIKGAYLEELQPKFREMHEEKHICPNDKTNSATFWAQVENTLPEQTSMMPCDCSF